MFRKKAPEHEVLDAEALAKAEVVFSHFSAAQANADGFILVGTVHFNPGEIAFDEGRAEFALRHARISACGQGCSCEYESIAYIARSEEQLNAKAEVTKTLDTEKGGEAEAKGHARASLAGGASFGGEAQGKLRRAFGEQQVQTLTGESKGVQKLITAIPKKRNGNRAEQVDWLIRPDPLIPFDTPGGTYAVLFGERMRAANEGAGLAIVRVSEPGGYLEMRLEVRAADIQWTHVEFAETSRLHQFGKRLVDGREKRDIVGRLALGKALEGSVVLQRLPREAGDE